MMNRYTKSYGLFSTLICLDLKSSWSQTFSVILHQRDTILQSAVLANPPVGLQNPAGAWQSQG